MADSSPSETEAILFEFYKALNSQARIERRIQRKFVLDLWIDLRRTDNRSDDWEKAREEANKRYLAAFGREVPCGLDDWKKEAGALRLQIPQSLDEVENLIPVFVGAVQSTLRSSQPPKAHAGSDATPANNSTKSTPKPRGRRKADHATVEWENNLHARWVRARDNGTYKGDFAKQEKMTKTALNAILDRVRKRKLRRAKRR